MTWLMLCLYAAGVLFLLTMIGALIHLIVDEFTDGFWVLVTSTVLGCAVMVALLVALTFLVFAPEARVW